MNCPKCGGRVQAEERSFGRILRCSDCGSVWKPDKGPRSAFRQASSLEQPPPRAPDLREIAAILWQGVRPPQESDREALPIIQKYSPLNADSLLGELLFLRIAAVDFATYTVLGNASARTTLLNAFFGPFEELASQRPDYARNFAAMKARLSSYSDAATTEDRKQFLWNIGKLFAAFCRCEMEPTVALVGSTMFGGTVQAVQAAMREAGFAG